MTGPSAYELNAWKELQDFKPRTVGGSINWVNAAAGKALAKAGQYASQELEKHPRANSAVKGAAGALGSGVGFVKDVTPAWVSDVHVSAKRMTAKVSRAGLTKTGVVKKFQKAGLPVEHLFDLHSLDLEQVDDVRGSAASWYYPAIAAASGAGAGLAVTGGGIAVGASAGAAAAPSLGAVAGAMAADMTAVLALSTRAVGQIGLSYGYDPDAVAEKAFALSVVNVATASSQAAKAHAMQDLSKLTQSLARGRTWAVLNESFFSRAANQLSKQLGERLTKTQLGKAVPGLSIATGAVLNWAALESTVEAANFSYRRRFLLEKYPELQAQSENPDVPRDDDVITAFDDVPLDSETTSDVEGD